MWSAKHLFTAAGLLALTAGLPAAAQPAAPAGKPSPTTSGAFVVDPPTLVSLGFEWRITGDDNRNAKVEVSFRKKGEGARRPRLSCGS